MTSGGNAGETKEPSTGEHVQALLDRGLDRYALHERLGVGGMGEVYRGVHRAIEKEVAVKVLSYEHRRDPKLNQRFLDEARAASKIRHENVVDITDFGHSPQGCAYFVMEYLEGEDLACTLRREGALPLSRARHLMVQLLAALKAAHEHGVVHRDIKPANCMRTTRGHDPDFLKVLDFGIARVTDDQGESRERLTRTGAVIGTAQYMAPEQARGGTVDPRTDLYAAAVVLFEMVTGRLPFSGATAVEVLSKHLFEEPPRASEVAPEAGISPELDDLLARGLAKDPDERFADADEMAEALEAIEPVDAELSTGAHVRVSGTSRSVRQRVTTVPDGVTTRSVPTADRRWPLWMGLAGGIGAGALLAWGLMGLPLQVDPCPPGMVLIPGGTFFMGTDDDEHAVLQSGRPTHRVELGDYCIDRHEVTVDQFHACSDRGECRRPHKDSRWDSGLAQDEHERRERILSAQCNERYDDRGDHPVNCVTWEQARDYCAFVGRRLPTEAEWEFAARGSDGRVFPWGDDPPTHVHGNLCNAECRRWRAEQELPAEDYLSEHGDGYSGTAPVGSFPAGATQHGLHDIVGNVFEWTASEFALYEGHPDGSSPGEGRVIRGGAHNSAYAVYSDPALRFPMDPRVHTHAVGFRCAASPRGE